MRGSARANDAAGRGTARFELSVDSVSLWHLSEMVVVQNVLPPQARGLNELSVMPRMPKATRTAEQLQELLLERISRIPGLRGEDTDVYRGGVIWMEAGEGTRTGPSAS